MRLCSIFRIEKHSNPLVLNTEQKSKENPWNFVENSAKVYFTLNQSVLWISRRTSFSSQYETHDLWRMIVAFSRRCGYAWKICFQETLDSIMRNFGENVYVARMCSDSFNKRWNKVKWRKFSLIFNEASATTCYVEESRSIWNKFLEFIEI